jgi:hypothetical protein
MNRILRAQAGNESAAGTGRIARDALADGRWSSSASPSSDPKNNFLAKRLGFCANCNLLDGVPKVDGFFSLTPRESDDVLSLFYGATNADFPQAGRFHGRLANHRAGRNFPAGNARRTFLPLVTAGQKPVFLDDAGTLHALTQAGF